MSDNPKFCTQCGCNLGAGMQFCPQCGKVVDGTEAYSKQKQMEAEYKNVMKESQRSFFLFAFGIYAIPALLFGLLMVIDAANSADVIFHNADFIKYYQSHHWTFSQGDLQNFITCIGVMETLSGACALGTLVCIIKHQKRMIAFGLCLAAAVLCIWSLFGMLIGFLMAWYVYSSVDLFDDEPKDN